MIMQACKYFTLEGILYFVITSLLRLSIINHYSDEPRVSIRTSTQSGKLIGIGWQRLDDMAQMLHQVVVNKVKALPSIGKFFKLHSPPITLELRGLHIQISTPRILSMAITHLSATTKKILATTKKILAALLPATRPRLMHDHVRNPLSHLPPSP